MSIIPLIIIRIATIVTPSGRFLLVTLDIWLYCDLSNRQDRFQKDLFRLCYLDRILINGLNLYGFLSLTSYPDTRAFFLNMSTTNANQILATMVTTSHTKTLILYSITISRHDEVERSNILLAIII
jgi:hypothetical protein